MTKTQTPNPNQPKTLFIHHLLELRTRLILSILALLLSSFVGYLLHDYILDILLKPINQPLFYTSPAGGVNFVINTSLFFGFIVSVPFFIYQLFTFLQPVLPKSSQITVIKVIIWSVILMVCGLCSAYFLILPATLHFLTTFTSEDIQAMITVQEYFSFITIYLAGFAFLFQLPLIMLLINKIVKLKPSMLIRQQKYVVVSSFILAAIITPTPDLINQFIMAVPLIFLYQLAILFVWLAE